MRKDKEWLREKVGEITKNYESFSDKTDWNHGYIMALHDYKDLIDQLEEPKKVKIPQFVADLIENIRKYNNVMIVGYKYYQGDFGDSEFAKWLSENKDAFARAWLDGDYEIEKEERFHLECILPALKDSEEVYLKHDIDSLHPNGYLEDAFNRGVYTESLVKELKIDETGFKRVPVEENTLGIRWRRY